MKRHVLYACLWLAIALAGAAEPRVGYPLVLDEDSGVLSQYYCNIGAKPIDIHLFTLQNARGRIWAQPDVDLNTVLLKDEDCIQHLDVDDIADVRMDAAQTAAGINRYLALPARGFLVSRFPIWEMRIWPRLVKAVDGKLGYLVNTFGGLWGPSPSPEAGLSYVFIPRSSSVDNPGFLINAAQIRALQRLERAAQPVRQAPGLLRSSVSIDRAKGLVRVTIDCMGPGPAVLTKAMVGRLGERVVARPVSVATPGNDLRAEPRPANPEDPAGGILLLPGEGIGADLALHELAIWPILQASVQKDGRLALLVPDCETIDAAGKPTIIAVSTAVPSQTPIDAAAVREMLLLQREQAAGLD